MEALALIGLVVLAFNMFSGDKKPDPPSIGGAGQTVNFDRKLLQECPPLPELNDTSDIALIEHTKKSIQQYNSCATNKNTLNTEIKKAFNIKDE